MNAALIDGDILCYRAAAACENETIEIAKQRLDGLYSDVIMFCDHDNFFYDNWKIFVTGKGNFREAIATTAVYKGNRNSPKPKHLYALRDYSVERWKAKKSVDQEADDDICIAKEDGDIICSVDKDFKQMAGWHYNFVKKEHSFITEEEAIRFFYSQILMGDNSDNIIGLYKVGPVKANKMLADCQNEKDMYNVCVKAYNSEERVIENARLLWLRRFENQLWEPPK